MAATSTAINACNAAIWLDDATGVPRDISGSSNVVTLNFDNELGEFQAFQDGATYRLECGEDASFEVTILYSTTTNEGADILKNWYFGTKGDRSFAVYLPDKDVGSDKYYCEVKIDNWSMTPSRSEASPIAISLVLVPNGAVSWTTAAT